MVMAIRGKSGIETPFTAAVTPLLYSPLIDFLSIEMRPGSTGSPFTVPGCTFESLNSRSQSLTLNVYPVCFLALKDGTWDKFSKKTNQVYPACPVEPGPRWVFN
jgi:hypothetical protein